VSGLERPIKEVDPRREPSMSVRSKLSGELRAWWATMAAICLLGAAVAYGVTWYRLGELERDAVRDARKLAVDSLQPLLTPADVEAPIRGARYEELAAAIEEDVMVGPANAVVIWRDDGTILFADDPGRVGEKDPQMRDAIYGVVAGTSEGIVDGDRFRALTSMRVGEPEALVVAEIDRSHTPMVAEARDPWYVWVGRGLVAAAIFAVLYVVTGIFFAVLGRLDVRNARRETTPPRERHAAREGAASPSPSPDRPAYMQPGFQEEVQARRRVEEELENVEKERDSLRARVRSLEAELEAMRSQSGDSEPAADVVPLSRR
jgi:hypothetical protein